MFAERPAGATRRTSQGQRTAVVSTLAFAAVTMGSVLAAGQAAAAGPAADAPSSAAAVAVTPSKAATSLKPTAVRAVRVLRFPTSSSAVITWSPTTPTTTRGLSFLVRTSKPNSATQFGRWLPTRATASLVTGLAAGAVHRFQVVARTAAGRSIAATLTFRQPTIASPGGRPKPNPTPVPRPTPVVVSVSDFGAKGDGVTDDTAAIQRALASMHSGETLVFPAGRTFVHASSLSVVASGTRLTGGGVLLASDERNSKLLVRRVNNTTIDNLTFKVQRTTRRWAEYEKMGIVLLETNGSRISDVTIEGTGSAGLYVGKSRYFALNRIAVKNSRADSIHITEGSHDGVINDPVVTNSGDDGVSIVSYRDGSPPVTNVTINNPRLTGQVWGRAFAVVGGTNIAWHNIYAEGSSGASVYIAAEREWNTLNCTNIMVDGGSIVAANRNAAVDHGAVMMYNSAGGLNSNITIRNLNITDTRADAARQVALIDNGGSHRRVSLRNITVTGGPTTFWTDGVAANYNLVGWSKDGVDLPDRLGWR